MKIILISAHRQNVHNLRTSPSNSRNYFYLPFQLTSSFDRLASGVTNTAQIADTMERTKRRSVSRKIAQFPRVHNTQNCNNNSHSASCSTGNGKWNGIKTIILQIACEIIFLSSNKINCQLGKTSLLKLCSGFENEGSAWRNLPLWC